MRKYEVDFASMNAEAFLTYFTRVVSILDHTQKQYAEHVTNLNMSFSVLNHVNKEVWLKGVVDPRHLYSRSTLLRMMVISVIVDAQSDRARLSLLRSLVRHISPDYWEVVLATEASAVHDVAEDLVESPRECLFQLCQRKSDNPFFSVLAFLLHKSPVLNWKNDSARYLAAVKNAVLRSDGAISPYFAAILSMIAEHTQRDFGLWFQTESVVCDDIDMQQGPSLFTLLLRNISARMKGFKGNPLSQQDSLGTFEFSVVDVSKTITFLLECLYHIVKNASPACWSEKAILPSLGVLFDLANVGFECDFLVKMVQYIVSHLSETLKSSITEEKKAVLLEHESLKCISLMLTTSAHYPIDLRESFALFRGVVPVSESVISIKECLDRIESSEPQKIIIDLMPLFHQFDEDILSIVVKDEAGTSQVNGLSFFHALVLLLRRKFTEPEQLCAVFDALCGVASTKKFWDWIPTEKSDCVKKTSLHSENTPYRVIWNLCQQEKGYYFLPVLVRVLREISKERWQSEPFLYVGLATNWLQKKKESLTLSVVDFFRFVVAEFSEDSSVFFQAMDSNLSGKKTSKVKQSAVCVLTLLADTLNDLLKNAQDHLEIVKPLLASLASIVDRSASEDWEPMVVDDHAPLNALGKLVLNHPAHADVLAVFSDFLKKATQESLNALSIENARKLLLIGEFSQNKALLGYVKSKESKVKKSAPASKPVQKPAAKSAPKSVAKAKALPPQQKAKSVASKTPFFAEKPKLPENPEVIVHPGHLAEVLDSQSQCVALPEQVNDDEVTFFLPPPKPPARWADDVESQPVTFFSMPVEKAQTFSKMGKLGEAFWQSYVEQCVRK